MSLEGWLLCNGAFVSRTVYEELFLVIKTRFGVGDGVSTFTLPNLQFEYHSARLVKGAGGCPSNRFGVPVGSMMPFNADSNV
jgi:microcystin-dependent protein